MPHPATPAIACALACIACGCGSAFAQLSEREFLAEFPTVLSASRLRQSIADAPQAVTVIDQDTIRASGVREIAELFRLVPGFNVQYATSVKGLQPIVTYHGLGREFFSRLEVLIDGRSMNNATLGGVDWSDFPLALDDIERIEVVRGPSTASHGVGAFLATINFITKHPAQQLGAYASVTAGSKGILDGVARYAGSSGALDYRVTFAHRSDDGFPGAHDRRKLDFATVRADWQIGVQDSVMMQAGATARTSGVGSGQPFEPTREARFDTSYVQVNWERSYDADNGFSVQAYHYRFDLADRFLTDPLFEFNGERFARDEGSTIERTDVEFQQTFSIGATSRWVWGASYREDIAKAPAILAQDERLRLWRAFGHVEWRATRDIVVNAGAMVENSNLTGTDFAPQASINFTIAPRQVIRLGVSKALRNPTLFEEKVRTILVGPGGTPIVLSSGIQAESIVSTELGYNAEWSALNATVDAKVFHDRLHHLIGLIDAGSFPPDPFPRTIVSGDDARQHGVEGQIVWRPGAASIALSASHIVTESTDRFAAYSRSAPRNIAHVLWTQRFSDASDGSLSYHRQSAYQPLGLDRTQSGFDRVDVRLATRLPTSSGTAQLSATVENVFDQRYAEFGTAGAGRRRAWVTLALGF